jgi:hypothetical protein
MAAILRRKGPYCSGAWFWCKTLNFRNDTSRDAGSGLSSACLLDAETEARRRGYAEIRLYTHVLMTENLALYARLGFHETGRVSEKGHDRIYMAKRLARDLDPKRSPRRSPRRPVVTRGARTGSAGAAQGRSAPPRPKAIRPTGHPDGAKSPAGACHGSRNESG